MLFALLAACGGAATKRQVLEEYRAVLPRRQAVQPVWLASATTDELHGRLALDGRRLVYASNQKGNLDIWVKDLTTGLPRRITSHVTTDTQPAWSPDGKRVVFVSMRLDVKGDAYLWDDGDLTRLTDRHTADSYPTFSPDGRAVFLASGPEGMSRIERLDLGTKRREPVTEYGATHPAVSPDGRLLAFTRFDRQRRGQIGIVDLETKKVSMLTTTEYHAGFPAFSPDGGRLTFSRFLAADPGKPLTDETNRASLWAVEVGRALRAGSAKAAEALARPLTSGRHTVLFVQDTKQGLVFTSSWAGSLDVGLLPRGGPFPELRSPRAQLELALAQKQPRDRLLGLQLAAHGKSEHASRARYLMACLHRELGEFPHARKVLHRLASESAMAHGEWAYLAQIDEVSLDAEEAAARKRVAVGTAARALEKLTRLQLPRDPSPRVAAHLSLRRGDLQRLGGKVRQAMKSYGEVIERFGEVRDHAVEARFHQGELFETLGQLDRRTLSIYYLGLFRRYPEQAAWLRRSAAAVLRLHSGLEPTAEVEALRALSDAHGRSGRELFVAIAQIRIGRLYEKLDRLDLAIAAMARVVGLKGAARATAPGEKTTPPARRSLDRERTEAAFELGRLSLKMYDRLREKGRLSEALAFYDKALGAYARVLERFERGHENHTRARTEFIRLSLLMAAQLERDGELALCEKRYRALLKVEPDNYQAHRKLIQFGVKRGERDALIDRYEERVDRDAGDHVGHYALGYLATFSDPLDASDLDRAEKHLKRAVGLYPKSPFGHMTMGWVYEMRERALGQVAQGRLEEADLHYDRAFNLNDARLDVQTEADLLINRCNTFANLGNKWGEAYTFCHRRFQLKIPFLSKKRAVSFNMTYGRAASATGRHRVADEALERALDLARDLQNARLEAEAVARLGLSAFLQGKYRRSNRYFQQALELFSTQGRTENMAALRRSMAVNLARRGRQRQAFETLADAAKLLAEHGTPPIEDYNPVTARCGKLCTTAPYGFEDDDEVYVSRTLKQNMQASRGAWPEVSAALEQRIASRKKALEEREHEELARELLLLQNDLALTRLRLGDPAAARKHLDQALSSMTKMLTDEEEKEKKKEAEQAKKKDDEDAEKQKTEEATLFPLQTALALNRAEGAVSRLAVGEAAAAGELVRARALLEEIETRRAEATPPEGKGPLPPRLRLTLWTNLGLLSFHDALGRPTASAAIGARAPGIQPAERALRALTRTAAPFVVGARWMRKVLEATEPAAALQVDPLVREDLVDRARRMGVLEPLWRPLSFQEQLRWHVIAGLNLARMTSAFTPRKKLANHPGTELLRELAALGLKHELGALRFVVSAELAYRRDDLRAMEAAVRGFLDRTPLLLDESYLKNPRGAARHRDLIFGRAVQLALEHDEIRRAVAWAEQRERRAFQDELCAVSPAGWGRVKKPLAALLAASRRYRRQLALEPLEPPAIEAPGPTSKPAAALPPSPANKRVAEGGVSSSGARQAWRARLNKLEHEVQGRLKALRGASPWVSALFAPVPEFPEQALLAALSKDRDLAVTALVDGSRRVLVALAQGKEPQIAPVKASSPAAVRAALARLVKGSKRVYVDLGRLDPKLSPSRLLPAGVKAVRLATLWQLSDAHARRNLALSGRLVVDPRPAAARRLARALGTKEHLSGERLSLDRGIDRALERAGVVVWSGRARFDGGLSTNLRLLLHDPEATRLRDLRPARVLGMPLRGHLLVLAGLRHTADPRMARAERVALSRLFHTMGVPSILIYPDSATLGRELKPALDRLRKDDLPGALGRSSAVLLGYGGMEPDEAKAFAKKMLAASARSGVVAFKRRRMTEAVEHLEGTLRYMEYTGDFKYQEGALEFLAQAYTLLEDYARAVPLQERLLKLRRDKIKEAPAKQKLAAQAKWVKAVKDMAWLRLRNEQYDHALKANMEAIKLYKQVKRPLLALESYEQRAIIAEKKGDNRQALAYARRALDTAKKKLAPKPKDVKAGLAVAAAARRVARLQRMLFSRYRAAYQAAQEALTHTPKVEPSALTELAAKIKPLMAQRKQLLAKKQAPKQAQQAAAGRRQGGGAGRGVPSRRRPTMDAKQLAALTKQLKGMLGRRALMSKALRARVQGMLEVVRIQGARGDYNRAVQQAERALELAKAAKLPEQDAALLELVNNLYYTGAHGPALARASEGLQRTKKPKRRIQFYNARGTVYAALGKTDQALKELSSALSIATRLNEPTEMAASHNNIGNALRLAGRFAEARRAFMRALELDLRQEDKLGIAFDHANLGLTFELMGRGRDARRHLQKALKLSKEIGAPLNELKALAGLGRIELLAGKAAPARALFQSGLKRATTLGLRAWIWRFNLLLGRALRKLGQNEQARRALDAGVRIVERQPPRLRKALGAPRVEEQPEDLYDELIDLLVALGKTEAAFDLGERRRGRAVVDLLGQKSVELSVAKIRALLTRITALQQALEAARAAESRAVASRPQRQHPPGSTAVGRVSAELVEVQRAQKELLEARAALAAVNPQLPRLVMTDTQPLSKLRDRLPAGATILSYVPTRDRLLIFALRRGAAVRAVSVNVGRKQLTRTVERYREALLRFHPVDALAAKLHGWLVAPVTKATGQLPERLVIVPGGPLHLLSFAALHRRGAEPLLARHTISYLSGVNALRDATRKKEPSKKEERSRTSFGWAGGARRPLSFTVRETEVFAAAFPGATAIQGKEATKSRFLAEAPRSSLLHVATHAEFRPETPLSTALELADGELPLLEVLGLELAPRSLVILSACETGVGPIDGADAVVGLHRAFRAAGAGRVISSLWRVSDLGAALTMKHLFRSLRKNLSPARALRAAQSTLRKRFSHPAFWAAFRLDGEP